MNIDYSQASLEIQSRHFFIREEPMHSRFARFFSADPRFPFSIAFPQKLEPSYDDAEYLNTLYVTFGKGVFGVIRSDVTWIMGAGDRSQAASQIPLSISPQIETMLETLKNWGDMGESVEVKQPWHVEKREDLVTVGEPGFKALRVVWKAGDSRYGEWVVFQLQFKLWTIFRNSIASFSSDDFNTILRSFRFLDDAFFLSLGVRGSNDS